MQPFWRTKEFGLDTPAEFVVEMGGLYTLTLRKKPGSFSLHESRKK